MSDRWRDGLSRAAWVCSCIVLAVLYGFAAHAFGWFPYDVLEAASEQASPIVTGLFGDEPAFASRRRYDRSGVRAEPPQAPAAAGPARGASARDPGDAAPGPGRGGRDPTLVPSNWEAFGWRPGLKLIDARGRTLHRWRIDPTELFPGSFFEPLAGVMSFNHPHGSHLTPDGDVLVNIGRIGTARLDACGRLEWRLAANSHHAIEPAGDGTFWLPARTDEKRPDPIIDDGEPVRHDLILHVSGDGQVLDTLRVFDVIEANPGLLRLHLAHQPDDTHLNDVEPLTAPLAREYPMFEAGDLLVSLKHLNVVFVLDPASLSVRWSASGPFLQQHDPDFMGDGWIGVFDNREDGTERGTRLGGSRIVAFRPHTDSMRVVEPVSGPLYTSNRGNWQPLPGGNLLLTESNAGRVVEITPDGRTVWEWIHPPYDSSRVPRVYWAERYDLTPERIASWPCSPDEGATG